MIGEQPMDVLFQTARECHCDVMNLETNEIVNAAAVKEEIEKGCDSMCEEENEKIIVRTIGWCSHKDHDGKELFEKREDGNEVCQICRGLRFSKKFILDEIDKCRKTLLTVISNIKVSEETLDIIETLCFFVSYKKNMEAKSYQYDDVLYEYYLAIKFVSNYKYGDKIPVELATAIDRNLHSQLFKFLSIIEHFYEEVK